MSAINTIKVIYKPGKYEMVINEDDFDDKIHEKPAEVEKPAKGKKTEAKNIDEEVKNLIGEE